MLRLFIALLFITAAFPAYADVDYYFSDDSSAMVFNRIDKALEHPPNRFGKTLRYVIDGNTISIYLITSDVLFIPETIDLQNDPAASQKLNHLLKQQAQLFGEITCTGTSLYRTNVAWNNQYDQGPLLNINEFLHQVVEERNHAVLELSLRLPEENKLKEADLLSVAFRVPSFFRTSEALQETYRQLNVTEADLLDETHRIKINQLIDRAEKLSDDIATSLVEQRNEYIQYNKQLSETDIMGELDKLATWSRGFANDVRNRRDVVLAEYYENNRAAYKKNKEMFLHTFGFGNSDEDMFDQAMALTADAGYIIAGESSLNGSTQPLLLKFNANNHLQWQKLLPGTEGVDIHSRAIVETQTHDLLTALLQTANGNQTSSVAKLSATGVLLWQKDFPNVILNIVAEDNNGNYYAGGRTHTQQTQDRDAVLIKLSPSGTVLWQKTIGGSADKDTLAGITALDNGNLLLCGYGTKPGTDISRGFLAEIDGDGQFRWTQYCADSGTLFIKALKAADGSIITAGEIIGDSINQAIAVKADASGNLLWQKILFESLTDQSSHVNDLALINDEAIIAGDAMQLAYLCRLDNEGNQKWINPLGDTNQSDSFSAVKINNDGQIIASGTTATYSAPGSSALWVLPFSQDGKFQ